MAEDCEHSQDKKREMRSEEWEIGSEEWEMGDEK